MPSPARAERLALCDLFVAARAGRARRSSMTGRPATSPPTSSIRERRPDAAAGIVVSILARHAERVRRQREGAPVDRARRAGPRGPAGLEPDARRGRSTPSPTPSSSSSTTRTSGGPRTAGRSGSCRPSSRTPSPRRCDRSGGLLTRKARVGIVLRTGRPPADPAAAGRPGRHDQRPDRRGRALRLRPQGRRRGHARRARRRRRRRRGRPVRPLTAHRSVRQSAPGGPGIGSDPCLVRSWGLGCCAPRTPPCSPVRLATSTTSTCPASCTPSSPAPRSPTPASATVHIDDAARRCPASSPCSPPRRSASRRTTASSRSTTTSPGRRSPPTPSASSARRSPSSSARR